MNAYSDPTHTHEDKTIKALEESITSTCVEIISKEEYSTGLEKIISNKNDFDSNESNSPNSEDVIAKNSRADVTNILPDEINNEKNNISSECQILQDLMNDVCTTTEASSTDGETDSVSEGLSVEMVYTDEETDLDIERQHDADASINQSCNTLDIGIQNQEDHTLVSSDMVDQDKIQDYNCIEVECTTNLSDFEIDDTQKNPIDEGNQCKESEEKQIQSCSDTLGIPIDAKTQYKESEDQQIDSCNDKHENEEVIESASSILNFILGFDDLELSNDQDSIEQSKVIDDIQDLPDLEYLESDYECSSIDSYPRSESSSTVVEEIRDLGSTSMRNDNSKPSNKLSRAKKRKIRRMRSKDTKLNCRLDMLKKGFVSFLGLILFCLSIQTGNRPSRIVSTTVNSTFLLDQWDQSFIEILHPRNGEETSNQSFSWTFGLPSSNLNGQIVEFVIEIDGKRVHSVIEELSTGNFNRTWIPENPFQMGKRLLSIHMNLPLDKGIEKKFSSSSNFTFISPVHKVANEVTSPLVLPQNKFLHGSVVAIDIEFKEFEIINHINLNLDSTRMFKILPKQINRFSVYGSGIGKHILDLWCIGSNSSIISTKTVEFEIIEPTEENILQFSTQQIQDQLNRIPKSHTNRRKIEDVLHQFQQRTNF